MCKTETDSFTTMTQQSPLLANLYTSIRSPDGAYDTMRLNKQVHDVFLANFSVIVRDGDEILARVEWNGVFTDVSTVTIRDGSLRTVDSESILFLPFSKDSGKAMQTVTLEQN